jgi:hypothetical protein
MSDPVWIALIAAVPTTVIGLGQIWLGAKLSAAKKEIKQDVTNLHKEVNGRMTELIQTTREAAHATGRAEGIVSVEERKPGQ